MAYRDQPWRAWYKTAEWRLIREGQRLREPLCQMCKAEGRVKAMDVCDHVQPHRGDRVRFFAGPFQSLCFDHHNSTKQREEQASIAQRGVWD